MLGEFAHRFFEPSNVTLDFTDMKVHIARGPSGVDPFALSCDGE